MVLCGAPSSVVACTYVFTKKGEAQDFRQADLVVTAEVEWQAFDRPSRNSGVKMGTARATVVDVLKGLTRPGAKVTYAVTTGHDGLCPVLWSTEPRRLYKLYLKRPKGGGPMEIIHRVPHFDP